MKLQLQFPHTPIAPYCCHLCNNKHSIWQLPGDLFVPLTRLSALWSQGLHYLLCIHNSREWRRCSLHSKKEWMHSWQQKFQDTQHSVYVIGKIIFSWLYKHSPQSCITTTIWSSLLWQVSNGTFISILSSFSFPILYFQMSKLNPLHYTCYPPTQNLQGPALSARFSYAWFTRILYLLTSLLR